MNLQKFTKAELISKLQKSDKKSDNSKIGNITIINQIKSYFSQIWLLILTFKNLLLKLTLITLLIRIFKKYSIFRRIWTILNTIVMSIFGISLLDSVGIDFITNFINEFRLITYNIIDYLSNNHFYNYLKELFSNNNSSVKQTTNQSRSMIESSKIETIRNETKIGENNRNSKISEWLKPQQDSYESVKENNNNKYYIIAIMLILSCLAWYYSDDIKTGGLSLLQWIRSFRSRPGDDPNGSPINTTDNIGTSNSTNLGTRLKNLFKTKDNSEQLKYDLDNSSQTTIRPIILEDKVASSSNIEPVKVQVTGLPEIRSDNFEDSADSVVREIDHFFKYENKADSVNKLAVLPGIYKVLRERLLKLSEINEQKYNKLTDNPLINNKIESLLALENKYYTAEEIVESKNIYNDVEQAAMQEQDVWSDRANSPSPKILSPVQESIEQVMSPGMMTYSIEDQQTHDYKKEIPSNLLDAIKSKRNESDEIENQPESSYVTAQIHPETTPVPPIAPEIAAPPATSQGIPNSLLDQIKVGKSLNPTETIVKDGFKDIKGKGKEVLIDNKDFQKFVSEANRDPNLTDILVEERSSEINKTEELPNIEIDTSSGSSSNKTIDHYFPETSTTQKDVKSGFKTLLDNIESNIKNSPFINQLGLHNSPSLSNKVSTSNLFEDTLNLFEDEDNVWDTKPENNAAEIQPDLQVLTELVNKAKISDLNNEDQKILEQESLNVKPDILIDKFKDLPDSRFKESLILENVDKNIQDLTKNNTGINKQQLIEKLIQENPVHKEQILSIVTKTLNTQLDIWEKSTNAEVFDKVKKELLKEDMKELETLAEGISIDKIKTLKSVNKSHSNLLDEIKKSKN